MANRLDAIANNIKSGNYQCIETDKATAKKIATEFVNNGWWFIVHNIEDYYYITTSTSVDLNWYNKRGYKFKLES